MRALPELRRSWKCRRRAFGLGLGDLSSLVPFGIAVLQGVASSHSDLCPIAITTGISEFDVAMMSTN